MIEKDDVISSLERMSRERFQHVCLELLQNMGFEISSIRSIGGDFEAEADIGKNGGRKEYIIRITRSGGHPSKEVESLKKILGPEVTGLYVTTSVVGDDIPQSEYIEVAGPDEFYNLLKRFDVLVDFDERGDDEGRSLPSASELSRLMDWGDEFRAKHNYHKAIEYYDKAIDLKPDALKPRVKKAEVLTDYGDPEAAAEVLIEVLDTGKESPDALTALGKIFHELGKYDDEIEAYDRALDINEDHIEAWNLKGATLYEQGLYEEAGLCFDRVLEVEPRDVSAWNNKGLCYMKDGDLPSAHTSLNNALMIKPDHVDSLLNKILVLEKMNKIHKAIEVTDELIAVRPDSPLFHYIKAAYLEVAGDTVGAYSSVKKSLKLKPEQPKATELKKRLEEQIEREKIDVVKKDKIVEKESDVSYGELEKDREYLIDKISKLEDDIGELKNLKERFKDTEATTSIPEEVVEEGKIQEMDEKDEEINKLKSEKERLEKELSKVWETRLETDGAEAQAKELAIERENLLRMVHSKEAELGELKDIKKELEQQLEHMKEEEEIRRKETHERLKEMVKELQKSNIKIRQLKEKLEILEENLASVKEDDSREDIIHEIKEKEKRIKELQEEKDAMDEWLKSRDRTIEDLKEEKTALKKVIDRYKREKEEEEIRRKETHERLKEIRERELKDNIRVIKRIMELLLKMGDHEKVLEISSEIDDPRLMNLKGCALYEGKHIGHAANCFSEATSRLSELNREEIYYVLGQGEKGVDLIHKMEDRFGDLCTYWERRGEFHRRLGNYKHAFESYEKAREISGDNIEDFLLAQIRCLGNIQDCDAAIERLKKMIRTMKNPRVIKLLGAYWYLEGDHGSAIKIFEKMEGREKAEDDNNLGCVAFKMEKYREAMDAFERAVMMEPDDPIYINNLGFCQLEMGKLKEAADNFSRAIELYEDDPVGWYNLGVALRRQGEEGWKGKVERALELAPDFKAARLLLES